MSMNYLTQCKIGSGKPLLCLEVNPPRGVDLDPIFKRLEGHLEGINYFNVTDSALARMRLAPLPFAATLKQRFSIEPLVNISCRDRNLIAIQGDLLAGWMLGVRSVVALTGDAVTIGDSPERKGVFEVNSIGLLNVIAALNAGKDISGNEIKGSPAYVSGVVVNPNARNIAAEIKRLRRKKEAGAVYALSQPVFDEQAAVQFFSEAAQVNIPIFIGLLPLKSAEAIQSVNKIPGIRISERVLEMVKSVEPKKLGSFFIDHCVKLAVANRPYVCGFHIISGTTPLLALQLARELASLIRGM